MASSRPTGAPADEAEASGGGGTSFEVNLSKPHSIGLGIKVDADNILVKVTPGSLVALDGRMRVGDKILSVNGTRLGGPAATLADVLAQQPADAHEPTIYRFKCTHSVHVGSATEKMQALVLQEKAKRHEKVLAAERAKAAKRRAALAAREAAEAAATAEAAAALRAVLQRHEQYQMPELEKVLRGLEQRVTTGATASAGAAGTRRATERRTRRGRSGTHDARASTEAAAEAPALAEATLAEEPTPVAAASGRTSRAAGVAAPAAPSPTWWRTSPPYPC